MWNGNPHSNSIPEFWNVECGIVFFENVSFLTLLKCIGMWNVEWKSTFQFPFQNFGFQIPFHSYSIVVVTNLFTMLFNFKFHSNSTVDGMECGISV